VEPTLPDAVWRAGSLLSSVLSACQDVMDGAVRSILLQCVLSCQCFDGVFPHWAQLKLPELSAAHSHGAHRQGSALPMARSESHSGPWSTVGDGRAHVVLLRCSLVVAGSASLGRSEQVYAQRDEPACSDAPWRTRRKCRLFRTSNQPDTAPRHSSAV
jgi:hypothetical protein